MKMNMWRKIEEIVRRVVRQELERALVRDITVETRRSDPANPQLKTERMSVLDYMLVCSNHTEGALRGMQADVGKSRNLIMELGQQTCQTFKVLSDVFGKKGLIEGEDVKRLPRNS
jgi:hypothetical protein